MSIILDLRPELEERLRGEAETRGISVEEYMTQLVGERLNAAEPKAQTGRELLAQLEADGLIGAWKERDDIGDTLEFARKLRENAQTRDWSAE